MSQAMLAWSSGAMLLAPARPGGLKGTEFTHRVSLGPADQGHSTGPAGPVGPHLATFPEVGAGAGQRAV